MCYLWISSQKSINKLEISRYQVGSNVAQCDESWEHTGVRDGDTLLYAGEKPGDTLLYAGVKPGDPLLYAGLKPGDPLLYRCKTRWHLTVQV